MDMMDKIRGLYREDLVTQEHYLSVLGNMVRELPFDIFKRYSAFFVPNDDYLAVSWGDACRLDEYGLYRQDGMCVVNNCIVFPCQLLNGIQVGWVSFNPFIKAKAMETGEYVDSYYGFPAKRIFDKGNYVFMLPEVYRKALEDGYIIVTDGVFDTVSLTHYGLNSCSLLGSYLSEKASFPLNFIDLIYISVDNDDAGLRMESNIKKLFPKARYIRQGFSKDIDDLLKSGKKDYLVSEILRCIDFGLDITLR